MILLILDINITEVLFSSGARGGAVAFTAASPTMHHFRLHYKALLSHLFLLFL